uniref:Uncharacterized protein n=1 Tax=Tanacetum cinerariifolium TaxID=118510 RepID=A0A6L2N6P3_TANCI|nr:hypothetical protein [Tanacetum cinerariifolium]
MYGETKEVEEAKIESEESNEEIEEETKEEEEDDSKYFDALPTIEDLGKPFVKEKGLVYNKEEGTVIFEKGKEKVIFKMPHKMKRFKHIDFEEMKADCIPPIVIEGNHDDHEKTYYSDSLNLGPRV